MPYVNGVLFNMSLKRNPESKPQWIISKTDLARYFRADLAKGHDGFIPKNGSQVLELVEKIKTDVHKKSRRENTKVVFQAEPKDKKEISIELSQGEIDKKIHRLKLTVKVDPGNIMARRERKRLRNLARRVQKIKRKKRLFAKCLDQIT